MFNDQDSTFSNFSANIGAKKPMLNDTPSDSVYEAAIADFAETQMRSEAMSIALTFIDDGEFSADQIDAMLIGFVNEDEDEDELDEDQEMQYEALAETLAEAFISLGATKSNAEAAINGDDESAATLGEYLADKMEDNAKTDDEIITKFAVEGGMIFEAKKRVVRDGKVLTVTKRTRKVRLSAAQRAALKKARRKAHTSAAKRARSKSMRIRKSRGL